MRTPAIVLVSWLLVAAAQAQAQGFKFSSPPDNGDAAAKAQRDATVATQLATPCKDRIRNRKIMVLIAEEKNGYLAAAQGAYSRHVEAVNARLRAVGLKTYTPEQIRRQVAQEEVDAYFKNDPDRALSAARRLAAQYVLRGVIASNAARNAMVNVNQVNVSMEFTLADAGSGKPVATAAASNASYSGSDTSGMALTLIEERADEVVARLYSEYCRNAAR